MYVFDITRINTVFICKEREGYLFSILEINSASTVDERLIGFQ